MPTAKQNGFTGNWENISTTVMHTKWTFWHDLPRRPLCAKESASLHPLAKEERQKQPARTAIHLRSPPNYSSDCLKLHLGVNLTTRPLVRGR